MEFCWLAPCVGASLATWRYLESLALGDSDEIPFSSWVILILGCFELLVALWKPWAQLIHGGGAVLYTCGIKIS